MDATGTSDVSAPEARAEPFRPHPGRLTLVFLVVTALGLAISTLLEGPTVTTVERDLGLHGPMVGQPAPEVVLAGFDGSTWRLSEHLARDGRPLVLNLWASWCAPCRAEIPEISAFAAAHPEIAVVGVAVQDLEGPARALVAETNPGYRVGMDATGRLRDLYPSFGMPVTFVIDETGVVRNQVEGAVTVPDLEALFG